MRKIEINPKTISVDEGFYFGKAVFETILWLEQPVLLGAHLKRMTDAMKKLDILPFTETEKQALAGLMQEKTLKNQAVKLVVSDANLVVSTRAITYTPETYEKGFSLKTSAIRRNASSEVALYKTVGYLENIREHRSALEQGYDDMLFYNESTQLCETAIANIFMVAEGKILTPPVSAGLLPGILRQWVLDNADVQVKMLTHDDVMAAEEFFITNSLMGIMPVKAIDDRPLVFGETTKKLHNKYRAFIQAHYA